MIRTQTFLLYAVFSLFVGVAMLAPLVSNAAEMYFKVVSNDVPGDEAMIVEAYIDPQSKNINVVEGVVYLQNTEGAILNLVLIETGGSVLSRWPVLPVYSKDEKVIRFTGGAPHGFDQPGLLFRMRIFASHPGKLETSLISGATYLNDGAGTKENISARSLVTAIRRGSPNQINAASPDSTPPVFDTVLLGRDEYAYDGKYFLTFHATDNVSGVSRYEIREGGKTTEVFDGVYVLRDQERKTRVDIIVYDHAGNSRSIQAPIGFRWTTFVGVAMICIVLGLLILAGLYVHRKFYKTF